MNVIGCILLFLAFLVGGIAASIRRSRYIGLIVLGLCVAFAASNLYKMEKWRSTFERVQTGDSFPRVKELMGSPPIVTDGTVSVFGDKKVGSEITAGIVEEYWYPSFFTPEQWSVGFGSDHKVISKHHYLCY